MSTNSMTSQQRHNVLTHWGRVTHICVGNSTIISSDNGLSPGRRQAIILINAAILLIGHLGTNLSEILIEIHAFSFKKMHLKTSSDKWPPSCLGPNVLKLDEKLDCLFHSFSVLTTEDASKPRMILCPSQRANNKGSVYIPWRHHGMRYYHLQQLRYSIFLHGTVSMLLGSHKMLSNHSIYESDSFWGIDVLLMLPICVLLHLHWIEIYNGLRPIFMAKIT